MKGWRKKARGERRRERRALSQSGGGGRCILAAARSLPLTARGSYTRPHGCMSCFVRPAWRARVNLAPLEEEEREKRAAAFLFSVLLPAFDARGRFCVPVIAPARWPFSRDGRWAGIRIRYGASGRAGATGRAMRRERERKRERPRAGVRCGRRARCARTRACAENLINTLPGRGRGAACVRACPGAQRRALRGPPMVRTRTTHTPALPHQARSLPPPPPFPPLLSPTRNP